MAQYEIIGDHEQRMRARLRSQFRNAPRLCALAQAIGAAVQDFEDAFSAVAFDTLFDSATGARLDLYGKLVGEDRGGLPDDLYLRCIRARRLANRSKGTEDDLWGVLIELVDPDEAEEVYLTGRFPASIYVRIRTDYRPSVQYIRRVGAILRLAKAAGVSFSGAWAVDTAYGFDGNPATLGLNQGQLAYGL